MNTTFTPEWKRFEKDLSHPDPRVQDLASDNFIAARNHALATDPQAKRWEESRKESLAKDKPAWVKQKRAEPLAPLEELKKNLKQAGSFDCGMKPSPGFLIIEIEKKEEKTESGIFLPEAIDEAMSNIGVVLETGGEVIVGETKSIPCPCTAGDKVMFKK